MAAFGSISAAAKHRQRTAYLAEHLAAAMARRRRKKSVRSAKK